MILPVVFVSLCAVWLAVHLVRRARRRRDEATMVVSTWPDIELSERYGGWNPGAYDAGTGHDRSPSRSGSRAAASRPVRPNL